MRQSLRIFGCNSLVVEMLWLRYSEVTDLQVGQTKLSLAIRFVYTRCIVFYPYD